MTPARQRQIDAAFKRFEEYRLSKTGVWTERPARETRGTLRDLVWSIADALLYRGHVPNRGEVWKIMAAHPWTISQGSVFVLFARWKENRCR